MKRLCVFYKDAQKWQNKPVDWIVCKGCQKKIKHGLLRSLLCKSLADYTLRLWTTEPARTRKHL